MTNSRRSMAGDDEDADLVLQVRKSDDSLVIFVSSGSSSVLQAVLYNNVDLLTELLSEHPTATHHKDSIGRGALHYAAARGQAECVRVIVNAGGTETCSLGSSQLTCSADVDAAAGLKDALKTALQLSSEMGHIRVVDILLDAGADVFHTDANGYSALQLAQMNDQKKTAERLILAIGSALWPCQLSKFPRAQNGYDKRWLNFDPSSMRRALTATRRAYTLCWRECHDMPISRSSTVNKWTRNRPCICK